MDGRGRGKTKTRQFTVVESSTAREGARKETQLAGVSQLRNQIGSTAGSKHISFDDPADGSHPVRAELGATATDYKDFTVTVDHDGWKYYHYDPVQHKVSKLNYGKEVDAWTPDFARASVRAP